MNEIAAGRTPAEGDDAQMAALSEQDFKRALSYVRACEAAADLPDYRRSVVQIVEHVPGHLVSYNEVDVVKGASVSDLLGDEELRFEGDVEAFARYSGQHPVIVNIAETGDLSPRALSDFLSPERLHALDLYQKCYARLEVEDQIAFGLPSSPELVLGVAISRREPGFSARDRAFLSLVAPHAGEAYLVARARSRAREALTDAGAPLGDHQELIVLDASSGERAEHLTAGAEPLLLRHQGEGGGSEGELPVAIRDHLARVRARAHGQAPLRKDTAIELGERSERRLLVRLVRGVLPGERDVLLLEERKDPVTRRRLRALGLSEREIDVVRLLVRGRSNQQIAEQLVISPHTVKRHLENVYPKLGARGRAETVVRLLAR